MKTAIVLPFVLAAVLGQLVGDFPSISATHFPLWVHEVNEVGGAKTVPDASFKGFVSNSSSDDFQGPFDPAAGFGSPIPSQWWRRR